MTMMEDFTGLKLKISMFKSKFLRHCFSDDLKVLKKLQEEKFFLLDQVRELEKEDKQLRLLNAALEKLDWSLILDNLESSMLSLLKIKFCVLEELSKFEMDQLLLQENESIVLNLIKVHRLVIKFELDVHAVLESYVNLMAVKGSINQYGEVLKRCTQLHREIPVLIRHVKVITPKSFKLEEVEEKDIEEMELKLKELEIEEVEIKKVGISRSRKKRRSKLKV